MTGQVMWTIMVALSYLCIIEGSVGMIVYVKKFPFYTSSVDSEADGTTFLGMKANAVWFISWSLIIVGTFIQFLDYVISPV